jgi:hypothetical protein
MRFRTAHLIGVTVLIAIFAAAFGTLGYAAVAWIRFVGCVVFSLLAIRAIAKPGRERIVLASAIVAGLPYFWFATFARSPEVNWFPTTQLAHQLYSWSISLVATPQETVFDYERLRSFAIQIAHVAFSFAFATLGAFLGAYWSKPKSPA